MSPGAPRPAPHTLQGSRAWSGDQVLLKHLPSPKFLSRFCLRGATGHSSVIAAGFPEWGTTDSKGSSPRVSRWYPGPWPAAQLLKKRRCRGRGHLRERGSARPPAAPRTKQSPEPECLLSSPSDADFLGTVLAAGEGGGSASPWGVPGRLGWLESPRSPAAAALCHRTALQSLTPPSRPQRGSPGCPPASSPVSWS